MPFFNFLSFILLYKVIVQYLNVQDIDRILRYFSYVIGIIAMYCILQQLDLDQFHKHFNTEGLPDQIVGTIGNPTHLGAWLAIALPVLYYARTKFSTISILLVWTVILLTSSVSALVTAIILTVFYNYFYQIRFKHERFLFGIIGIIGVVAVYLKGFDWIANSLLNPHGRFTYWQSIYPLFKEAPILGGGLGKIMSFNQHWKHVHNEYYQLAIEGGLIGLGIVIWGIYEYFKRFIQLERTKLSVCLVTMFIGFLLLSMTNFTCHLWQVGTLAMFSYSSLFCLTGGKL